MIRHNIIPALPLLAALLAIAPQAALAQDAPAGSAAPSTANRILGTVTSLSSNAVTVHPEGASAADATVSIAETTRLLRTAPGQTSLQGATPIQLSDLAVGDRVLILLSRSGDPAHPTAAALIAMKQTDIAQAHAAQAQDWDRRGVAGIVGAVDTTANTVSLKASDSPSGTLLLHVSPSTIVRRYAADSVSFANTHKATLADIHAGDQLRARGDKNATGTDLNAEELVAGSFRNIAGTVLKTDAAGGSLVITNLATKKPETLHVSADTQMRRLPEQLAARLAHRTQAGKSGDAPAPAASARPHADMATLLQRAPVVTLGDLKKGDAVMIVASGADASTPSAITVVSGVEPLLQGSSQANQDLLSASWNIGGGGGGSDSGEGGGASPQR